MKYLNKKQILQFECSTFSSIPHVCLPNYMNYVYIVHASLQKFLPNKINIHEDYIVCIR